MVLVQSRGGFVEQIMRALKEEDVDVAGIDRMTLTEEIAVMDLVALAQFSLLPKDDLTLATVLRSPLIGLSEDELFTLCQGRKYSLWDEVKKKMPEVTAYLLPLTLQAARATPYEFFAQALQTPCPADGVSGRRAFYGRLGFDIQDALDEFLNSCLHYEQSHTPSVQKFCDWFMRGEAEIKREQEAHKADQVRIMTVHASKGLQAPIVFLPDTVKKFFDHNKGRARLLWPEGDKGVPLWSPRKEFDAPVYKISQERAATAQEEEYRRLLYVALTRAEDRLYIAGHYSPKKPPKDNCWYKLVEAAFDAETDPEGIRRISHPQTAPLKKEAPEKTKTVVAKPLPFWAREKPAEEIHPSRPLAPSRPGEDEPAAKGPLAEDESWKFRRGVIVHQILEILPQMDEQKREKTLMAYLARPALKIPVKEQGAFAKEIMNVLTHPEFAPIFGRASRAEVPLVGIAGTKERRVVSGQMDRILVTEKEILIVDYKTNRPPPVQAEDVPAIYLKQMASYRSIMENISPTHTIKTALLWTDGPRLMPLPDKLLDPHAP